MKNDFKIGIIFTALGQYSNILIQLIINVVLSRILTPSEFGVVAIVQVFLVFFQMLVSAGMGPAIVQNRNLSQRDYGVLFNYSAILALVMSVAFGCFGFVVAYIYQNNIYLPLFCCMTTVIIAEGLNVVPNAILSKEKRFKAINIRLLLANLLGAIIGIVAALCGAGVYALILCVAVPAIITLVLNFFIVKITFTKSLDMKPLKEVWYFAKNQLGFSVINYFARNSDNILIGKFSGASALGNYSKAYLLTTMPNTVFLGIVNPVLQPILAEHEKNVVLIRETYFKIIKILSLLGFSVTAFMTMNADKIIYFLFGSQWGRAVLPLSILSLSIWAQMMSSVTGAIFQARNQPHILFRTGLISTSIILSAIVCGVVTGDLVIISCFVSGAYCINFFVVNYILLHYTLADRLISLLKLLIKPFLLFVLIVFIAYMSNGLFDFANSFLTLVVRGLVWLGVFLCYVVLTGEVKVMKDIFSKK